MSKVETIDALMESATLCFSKGGYGGTSLRTIATRADIPLGTIHMYFGSKAGLFIAVKQKAWDEINEERNILVQAALDNIISPELLLRDFIRALALPVVRRSLSDSKRDKAQILLIRNRDTEQWRLEVERKANHSMIGWIDALALACPTLSRQKLVWAYSFVVGSIYSWQLIDHRYDHLMDKQPKRTVDGVTGDIVAFGCAGVQAIIDRHKTDRNN